MSAAKVQKRDLQALAAIRECGFVSMESDGVPRLESSKQLTPLRFNRLLTLGLLAPAGDTLFEGGAPSQTYLPTDGVAA
jgi:hypothetical protein